MKTKLMSACAAAALAIALPLSATAQSEAERGAPRAPSAAAPSTMGGASIARQELQGAAVYDQAGARIGTVEDVIDEGGGPARAVSVSLGSEMGLGARTVSIETDMLQQDAQGRLMVPMSREQIAQLPAYTPPEGGAPGFNQSEGLGGATSDPAATDGAGQNESTDGTSGGAGAGGTSGSGN